jgi:RNA polymerase sigma factor (sigma-70 family)
MEVSALKYSGGIGLHARSPLLRLQSDERLVVLVRRGNPGAFEVLVSRYESRLLAFCRHLLGSREDAEDVLQEVFAAAFNAMTADDRPINVRPWLYRIARNRSLNHLRRATAVGVDSMDIHFHDNGASTADKVYEREEFRLLVGDIHELPETQKTALVLREMDALSYDQIAEAMETTVPSVKSLLVRARVSLAEAAEARLLSCDEVRIELGEVAEGLKRRPNPLVRRHLRACKRCSAFKGQLKQNNRALAAIMPLGLVVVFKQFLIAHLGHSAGSSATGAGASASAGGGAAGAGGAAAAGSSIVAGSTASGFVSAGMGAIATKAAAGLAAAALVTGAAVEVDHSSHTHAHKHFAALPVVTHAAPTTTHVATTWRSVTHTGTEAKTKRVTSTHKSKAVHQGTLIASAAVKATSAKAAAKTAAKTAATTTTSTTTTSSTATADPTTSASAPGRTQTQSDPTMLSPTQPTSTTASTTSTTTSTPPPTALAPVTTPPPDSSGTTTTTTTTTSDPGTPGPGSAPPASTGNPQDFGGQAQDSGGQGQDSPSPNGP